MSGELFPRPVQQPLLDWFHTIADTLLNHTAIMIHREPHRLLELEIYYDSAAFPDPFPHRHAQQRTGGQWHCHRVGSGFRGGSFKGLDLSFGDGVAYGGVLFRSLALPNGETINGPSLLVDYLLAKHGITKVAQLQHTLDRFPAVEPTSSLHLQAFKLASRTVYQSRRVGLSLKRYSGQERKSAQRFQQYPLRYLIEPWRINKGRAELREALRGAGYDEAVIRRIMTRPDETLKSAG